MDANSGSGRSGAFVWGILAGILAVIAAGGVYLSGVLGPLAPSDRVSGDEVAVVGTDEQAAEPTSAQTETNSSSDPSTGRVVEAQDEPDVSSSVDGDTVGSTEPAPAAQDDAEAPEKDATPVLAPPVLDQIFVETDGTALLSGKAEPGSQIRILLDGESVHSFTVDDSGQFAEFVAIPFSETARGLVLETANGTQSVQSDDYLIAALPKPDEAEVVDDQVANADVDPAADAGPQPTEDEQAGTAGPDRDTETVVLEEVEEPAVSDISPEEPASSEQQVAVLRSGAEGVELVQPPANETSAPDQVALDTIGYSDIGDVQLSGRVSQGAAVRLYLNNRLVADIEPEQDGGWRGEITDVNPGVYTLRVDEVDTDGTVLSRLETPFKREPVEVLQAAEAQDTAPGADQTTPIRSVTVQRGDTLWAISRDRFGDGVLYVRLFEANRDLIRDPDLIYPGQVFTIPE